MKLILQIVKWLVIAIALIALATILSGHGYLWKAVRVTYFTGHKTAYFEDYTYCENRVIKKGEAQPWNLSKDYNRIQPTNRLENTHKKLQTTSFLIIKNDSIWHESYFDIG